MKCDSTVSFLVIDLVKVSECDRHRQTDTYTDTQINIDSSSFNIEFISNDRKVDHIRYHFLIALISQLRFFSNDHIIGL